MIKVFIILLFLFFNKKYASKLKKSDGSCGGFNAHDNYVENKSASLLTPIDGSP